MTAERLQKVLSSCGFGSRRDCEKLIAENRVTVNGNLAKLGDSGDIATDDIRVNGQRISPVAVKHTYIILNKPLEVLSDIKDSRKRRTVLDLVDHQGYLFIVGRLDYRSEGLILLTDDGDIANQLSHPRYEHEKEYKVLIHGGITKEKVNQWRHGVTLEDGYHTLPVELFEISSSSKGTWIAVIMKEGKKRQIREVGKILGLTVKRIVRMRIGPIELGKLKSGEWRYLTRAEISNLKKYCSSS